MSLNQRREIAFWFLMIIGMAITVVQFYRYATNTLSYTTSEMIMNLIAVAFMIFPRWILNVAEKIVTNKKSKSNE